MRLEWYRGVSGQTAKDCEHLALGEAVCGTVAVSGQLDIVEDVQHRTDRKTTLVRTLGIQRYACFPCYQGTSVLGTLSFGSRHQERFQEKDLDMLQKVVELVCTRPR